MAAAAVLFAYQSRFDFAVPRNCASGMWLWMGIMALLRPISLMIFTGYRIVWRFLRVQDLTILLLASLPASLLLLTLRLSMRQASLFVAVPLGVIAFEFAMFVALATGARGLRRIFYEEIRSIADKRKQAVVLGTEDTLAAALGQIRAFPELEVVGLVTPGKHLRGFEIARVPVIAEPLELGSLLRHGLIDVVLIADASPEWIGDAISTAGTFGTDVRVLPSAANVMRGDVRVAAPVAPERVLGERKMLAPRPEIFHVYQERVVLVTGAGGSIGSEISRQVAELGISRLLVLDNDENSIFELQHEMESNEIEAELVPIVGDIRDERLLERVFARYRPDIVLHSAAYKHVPVMEANASEAVLNNILGTRHVVDAALDFSSERFVMISTDKAVRPASVMGATKRAAEMLVQSRVTSTRKTRLACVRFGNVVGSRGSVVPIFLKQIAEGKPVTITDQRMSRYFMTIKEAVRLVLEASSLDCTGGIYMLEMGAPVAIIALARHLIEMSALRPETDVAIEITGIRPGEKLHEALCCDESRVFPTDFPRVFSVGAEDLPDDFEISLAELEQAALERRDAEVIEKLRKLAS